MCTRSHLHACPLLWSSGPSLDDQKMQGGQPAPHQESQWPDATRHLAGAGFLSEETNFQEILCGHKQAGLPPVVLLRLGAGAPGREPRPGGKDTCRQTWRGG